MQSSSDHVVERRAPLATRARWSLALSLTAVLLPLLGFIVGAVVGVLEATPRYENSGYVLFSAFLTATWAATLAWAIGIVLGLAALALGITIVTRGEPGRKRAITAIILGGVMTVSGVFFVLGAWPLHLGPFF